MRIEKTIKNLVYSYVFKVISLLLNFVVRIVDRVYIEDVLPGKMKYNLDSINKFSFLGEIAIMFRTIFAVLGRNYE